MPETATPTKPPKVLLIGWDGADWEHITPLLDEGKLPTLERFINDGVMGNLSTLQPVLSPMLWNSVATAKYPDEHGILGFTEPDTVNGGARPFSSISRKTKALWNILSQSGYKSNVINWWASHPAEKINGCVVSNLFNGVQRTPDGGWQISDGTIHPAELQEPFAKFKVFPEELTEAHILPFIPNAAEIDQKEDKRLSSFAKTLAETATTHAIATAVMSTQPCDFMAVYYTGIDHFGHGFMQYHPPRMKNVSEKAFELYKGVMEGAYRFHDMMLETLLSHVDDTTTVILCSDHGFHSRSGRPLGVPREPAGPAVWHRKYGIFLAKGPGIKKDERIYGASLIDVGPTILSLFDLPMGEDMSGRPLMEIFEDPKDVKIIPSWEDVDGEHGMHDSDAKMSNTQSKELMKQFVALGYVDENDGDQEKQRISADCESRYNLSRSLLYQGKSEKALELLQQLSEEFPWETRFITQLVEAYVKCGYLLQAQKVVESAFDLNETNLSQLLLIYAEILLRQQEFEEGTKWLLEAEKRMPRSPVVYHEIGTLFMQQRRFEDARRNFEKSLEMDPEYANAWTGISSAELRLGRNQEAAESALKAVGLLHRLPKAHLNLGIALLRSEDYQRAELAFKTALKFAPKLLNAHRFLRLVYQRMGDTNSAVKHQALADAFCTSEQAENTELLHRRNQTFPIPDFGSEQERQDRLIVERPHPLDPAGDSGIEYVIVSGLPRSGTSLMMQMLEAGGITPISDGQREADVDNPKGYYELEDIKQIALQPRILDRSDWDGHALKVVSPLLTSLPRSHSYKVIFMRRPIQEIVISQGKMIERLETDGTSMDDEEVSRGYAVHLNQVGSWLKGQKNVEYLEVSYPDLVKSPESTIEKMKEFLGDRLTTADKMRDMVDSKLYRNKVK